MGANGAANLMDFEDDNEAGAPCPANYEKLKNGDDGSDEDEVDPYGIRDDWLTDDDAVIKYVYISK